MNITLFFVCYFLNLSTCFKFKNNKNFYKLNTKLNMNYYIDSNLHIHYKNDYIFSSIDLKNENSNYYEYKYINYSPSMKLVIIYSNNTFVNYFFEDKFTNLIETEIKIRNKNWHDINTIIKSEKKYDKNINTKY